MANKLKKTKLPEFYLSYLVFWLRFTGIEVLNKSESFPYKLWTVWCMLFVLIFTIIAYSEFTYHNDFKMISVIVVYVNYYTFTLAKVVMVHRNRKEVGNLMMSFHKGVLKPNNKRGGEYEEQCREKLGRKIRFHMICYGGSLAMAISSGLVASLQSRLTQPSENWILPFAPMSVMRINHSPNFEIMYAVQAVVIIWINMWAHTTNCTIIYIIAQTVARIKILEHCTRNYRSLNIYTQLEKGERLFDNALDYTINYHITVLETVDKLEYLCSYMILCVFLCSLVTLCSVMYSVSAVPLGSIEFVRYMFYFAMLVYEPFIYCWWGNEMTLANEELAMGISQAYSPDDPIAYSKALKLMLVRAQKPIFMTAAKFVPLSLETFKGILKASFSYFTVLRQVNSQESAEILL